MNNSWEADIAALLAELADVQTALLALLGEKRELLAAGEAEGLSAIAGREQGLFDRLEACHHHRQELLRRANEEGLPADSIRSLNRALPDDVRQRMQPRIDEAAQRSRLLQHQSLTHWVIVQRSLLHLSQLVEIIATGGRIKPTYGNGGDTSASGALVDQAV